LAVLTQSAQVMEGVQKLISVAPEESVLVSSFKQKTARFRGEISWKNSYSFLEEKEALLNELIDAVKNGFIVGYKHLFEYLQVMLKNATDDDGIWKFPR
jgi:hypothetical protein